jgi:hypothetical protein
MMAAAAELGNRQSRKEPHGVMPGRLSEIRIPIGNFVLTAAGEMLDLDAAILTLGTVITKTNAGIEKSIRIQAAEKAAEHGMPENSLLANHGAGLKVMLALKIGATPDAPAKRDN